MDFSAHCGGWFRATRSRQRYTTSSSQPAVKYRKMYKRTCFIDFSDGAQTAVHSGLLVIQSKYYELRIQFRHGIIEAASRDGDHLAAARACEDEWCGASSGRKITLPQQLDGCCIEGANMRIDRSAYKNDAGVSSRRTSEIRQSRDGRSRARQFAQRHTPFDRALVGTHCDQFTPRRTSARYARGSVEEFARHRKWRARLLRDFALRVLPAFRLEAGARDQSNHVDASIHWSNNQAIHGVPRCATPMHAADATRDVKAALKARRSEDTVVTVFLKHRLAGLEIFRSGAENVLGFHLVRGQRGRRGGKWLGGPGLFTLHIAPRYGTLFNRKQRLSGHAIEQEQVRGLRTDSHRRPVRAGK